ncbi:KaiB domain protein [Candidatus Magnetomorum sp. HK-1]|nr:KaiB domain protein [Candidatus Magnetomorum sp. HK-1]
MPENIFQLFIAGEDLLSRRAIKNMKVFCEKTFQDNYSLEIIDIEREPHLAGKYKISAIPTLVKKNPLPEIRIIGDLADVDQLSTELKF